MFEKLFGIFLAFIFGIFIALPVTLSAQTHSSVNLESQVYYILEQAEIRGLISPLSGSRPYTQSFIIRKINEILNAAGSKRLSQTERDILNQYLETFSKPKPGIDWQRGNYNLQTNIGADEIPISANIGVSADIEGSAGIYSYDNIFGAEIWLGLIVNGDLGNNFSYEFNIWGGLMRAPRLYLGKYNTYYEDFEIVGNYDPNEYVNDKIDVYSEPLTHFPFSYRKRWDGSVFHLTNLSGYRYWPEGIAGGYSLPAELTASFINDKLIMRIGRISREWGSTSIGSSLSLNMAARPFLAVEAEFSPVSWFSISSMTGGLEYYNQEGMKISSATFQNLFSVTMLQFRIKNYFYFEITDAVVYPKRFELGYIVPIINNFLYQNNVGDFDNMAVTLSIRGQIPGIGSLWVSLFVDEMHLLENLLTLDRQMLAIQGGINIPLPFLSFTSLKLSYTRINPYCYTHNRNFNPWYGDNRMATNYVNNGVSLGYYLPPNSDEILVRFETMPVKNLTTSLQYQLIRHGADFGSSAVDGSNLQSELNPEGRSTYDVLKRFFLHDGAYQWFNIIKVGIEWKLPNIPITLLCEAGAVISYFTNINGPANSGVSMDYKRINTSEYPESNAMILKIGVKVYGK